ncbi:MAG TPA: cyclase family protein [Victivallales bacterium]|nr:cyclase family protein [Victivallales bacterium]
MQKKCKIIDLSITIENNLPSDPEMMIPEIKYADHKTGAHQMELFFPGLKKELLPNKLGWAIENINLTTHSGTHLDAPYHFHPTMDNGLPALKIDEIPLEWCFSDGVLLDFRFKNDGDKITVSDIKKELKRIDYSIKPFDIVLIQTGADDSWGKKEYLTRGAGMTRESTLFLLEQGVKITGIDAWSWDRPLPFIAEEYSKTGNPDIIWEAHFAGIEKGYCHMEKMANFSKIKKAYGFKISCFPIKIKNASAGWVRPVAIIS